MKRAIRPAVLLLTLALAAAACSSAPDDPRVASQSESVSGVCSAGPTVKGIDTSFWQGPIDWPAVKQSGQAFAIVRVSDGLDYPDSQFPTDWPATRAAGLVRGVYQFFRPSQDPIAQADLLLEKLAQYGALTAGDLPPIADVETTDGVSAAVVQQNLQAWLDHIASATGRKPMIYTAAFMSSTLGSGFGGYPLWVANYGVTCPQLPAGWSQWMIWQNGDSGSVAGVQNGVDVDIFEGSLAQLLAFAEGQPPPPAPAGSIVCLGSQAGAYCGNDSMQGAVASTLYQCPGANLPPTSSTACPAGCSVAPAGKADSCATAPATGPICLGSQAGAYCGTDMVQGGDPHTLYQCPGLQRPPTSSQVCSAGCLVAAAGSPDSCLPAGAPAGAYRLPWTAGTSMWLTQDCDDACCNDHVGTDAYAWDFADATFFDVVAARGGTVTHLKMNSTQGCASSACADDANVIVIDHGDGTQSTYLHLLGGSLDPAITCGAVVAQGQRLAKAGSTGWASGTHLHYQVNAVHPGAPTCECGAEGQGCSAGTVPWSSFWVSATYPALPVSFQEWPSASQCENRRISLPASLN